MKDEVTNEELVYHNCTLDKFKEEIWPPFPAPSCRGCENWRAARSAAWRLRRHLIIFVNRKLKLNSLTRCEIGPLAEAGAGLGREG